MQIDTVLLCADILATRESEQASNLRWVADLLARPVAAALPGARVVVGLPQPLDRRAVLPADHADEASLRARHCWFDADRMTGDNIAALRAAVGDATLTVGYEMSRQTRAAFDRAGLPWIDIWLHPVRFADDILFGFRASDPRVQARIDRFAVNPEILFAQADLLRIATYRGARKFDRPLIDGAALFVGQTARDKSVLGAQGFLSLTDYAEDFADLARRHPHVYFSRHPNAPRLDPEIAALLAGFGNVSETDAPTYALLADPRIATVAALSSSVLEEARYFGKATRRFLDPPFALEGDGAYAPVLHDFCFSHFWGGILADVADVRPAPPAAFPDPRNKLREALSFYWGYKDIMGAPAAPATGPAASNPSPPAPTIETAGIVSFDVFDTLIVRRLATPVSLFERIAPEAAAVAGIPEVAFPDRRITAERQARAAAERAGREDPTLTEIHAALLGCAEDDPRVARLAAVEIAAERDTLRPRPAGRALFDAAKAAGRRIVLVSDMYLPRATVEDLLKGCGYDGWERIYLSSDLGKTKRTGTLFEHLIADLGVEPGEILHIGDNPRGDVAVPARLGIATRPLPKPVDILEGAAPFLKTAAHRIARQPVAEGSAVLAGVALRHFDTPLAPAATDDLGQDAGAFGYVALGPLLAGFAEWLHDRATQQGIARLGFLTREGVVFRAAYEALFPDGAVSCTTVFASRRMVRRAALTTRAAVEALPPGVRRGQFRSIADYLIVETGLDAGDIDAAALADAGFATPEAGIGPETPADALRAAVAAHLDPILSRAAEARAAIGAYLAAEGLTGGDAALVDIGYAGRVQAGFSEIAGTDLPGLYAATFRTARDTLGASAAQGYLAEGVDPGDRRIGICRHRHIYETLLCAPGPGYVGVAETDAGWVGVQDAGVETPLRDAFVTAAHAGALKFVRDHAADRRDDTRISPVVATAFLDAMLDAPTPRLAAWLGRLEFDDRFDSHSPRSLIAGKDGAGHSVWPEGAEALARRPQAAPHRQGPRWTPYGPYGIMGWRHALAPVVAPVIARIGDPQDADHYRDDPIGFFRRLSDPRYRRIGRLLYPWD